MRKIGIFTIIMFLLSSCALPALPSLPGLSRSTATATHKPGTPTVTPTITDTPTITATRPTPTFTGTPTLFGFKPTSTITGTPPTKTPTQTPLPLFPDTPTPPILTTAEASPGEGFKSFRISGTQVFWGICSPGTVTLETAVLDPDAVWRVYLFMRLKSVKNDDTTEWVGTTMTNHRDGRFTYVLRADLVDGRKNYLKAWVELQMVAVDVQQKEIGRTHIYDQALMIQPCP